MSAAMPERKNSTAATAIFLVKTAEILLAAVIAMTACRTVRVTALAFSAADMETITSMIQAD
jgi:hypothetical protein